MARKTKRQELESLMPRFMAIHVKTSDGINEVVLYDIMDKLTEQQVTNRLAEKYPIGYEIVNRVPRVNLL